MPYRVAYSERVRNELRNLLAKAKERGLSSLFLDAVKELDHRLMCSPRLGQTQCFYRFAGAANMQAAHELFLRRNGFWIDLLHCFENLCMERCPGIYILKQLAKFGHRLLRLGPHVS
jgi:hypothetical protein